MALRKVLLVAVVTLLLRLACSETSDGEQVVSREGEDCLSQYAAPATVLAVPEEVVLVLGNSGSGKSALAKHLSRHDGDMKAVRENGEFFIEGDGIGGSIASVTSVPELFHDNETATNYFDCPGFEDTRGPCSEVTTTYYMKDIARHARRVKVLLLAPHFAVRKGQDRSDFLTMLRHAARVLKDPAKLQQSLALVVTKVEAPVVKRNKYYNHNGHVVSFDLVKAPDSDVRSGVEAFLSREVRPFLAATAEDSSVQQEERTELRNAVKIVDILLGGVETRRDSRIGLFHAPDEVGALGDIEIMRNGRAALRCWSWCRASGTPTCSRATSASRCRPAPRCSRCGGCSSSTRTWWPPWGCWARPPRTSPPLPTTPATSAPRRRGTPSWRRRPPTSPGTSRTAPTSRSSACGWPSPRTPASSWPTSARSWTCCRW